MSSYPSISGLEIRGPMNPGYAEILTPEACTFLAGLFEKFGPRRVELLAKQVERQKEIDGGRLPDFLPETAAIRGGDWKVAPIPPDLPDLHSCELVSIRGYFLMSSLTELNKADKADFVAKLGHR